MGNVAHLKAVKAAREAGTRACQRPLLCATNLVTPAQLSARQSDYRYCGRLLELLELFATDNNTFHPSLFAILARTGPTHIPLKALMHGRVTGCVDMDGENPGGCVLVQTALNGQPAAKMSLCRFEEKHNAALVGRLRVALGGEWGNPDSELRGAEIHLLTYNELYVKIALFTCALSGSKGEYLRGGGGGLLPVYVACLAYPNELLDPVVQGRYPLDTMDADGHLLLGECLASQRDFSFTLYAQFHMALLAQNDVLLAKFMASARSLYTLSREGRGLGLICEARAEGDAQRMFHHQLWLTFITKCLTQLAMAFQHKCAEPQPFLPPLLALILSCEWLYKKAVHLDVAALASSYAASLTRNGKGSEAEAFLRNCGDHGYSVAHCGGPLKRALSEGSIQRQVYARGGEEEEEEEEEEGEEEEDGEGEEEAAEQVQEGGAEEKENGGAAGGGGAVRRVLPLQCHLQLMGRGGFKQKRI